MNGYASSAGSRSTVSVSRPGLFSFLYTLRSNAGWQQIRHDVTDSKRCLLDVAMAREAVVVRLLIERLHSCVGCLERTALHVCAVRRDASICPPPRNQGVVLPHAHRASRRQLREESCYLAIQRIDVEAISVVIVAVGRGPRVSAIAIDATDLRGWPSKTVGWRRWSCVEVALRATIHAVLLETCRTRAAEEGPSSRRWGLRIRAIWRVVDVFERGPDKLRMKLCVDD